MIKNVANLKKTEYDKFSYCYMDNITVILI